MRERVRRFAYRRAQFRRHVLAQTKGAAFADEMSLDRDRYGALTVLDRWGALVAAFGPHLAFSRYPAVIAEAPARVGVAESMPESANRLLDAADRYSSDVVEACVLAFQSLASTFAEERQAAEQSAKLGPMLPDEFKQSRGIFLQDLAAR